MKLLDKLLEYSKSNACPMHMPGHKRNSSMLSPHLPWKIDITEINGFDNLHEPEEILKEAQQNAAELFGSMRTFFLVGGSSCGILASIRACAMKFQNPKRETRALILRGCHKSVYNAVELCGIDPVYISPEPIDEYNINGAVNPYDVERALCGVDDIKFVVITSPTYEGVVSDIKAIADIVHRHNAVLIVDEAHGAHLGFSDIFPQSAVNCGADIVIQSFHKTLPSLTQTAVLHLCSDRVSANELQRQLSVFETSSPSYVLMSSIDECVHLIKADGKRLFTEYKERLLSFYKKTESLKKLRIVPYKDLNRDASKIVIDTSKCDLTGPELSDILSNRFSIEAEMSQPQFVLAMTSVCDTDENFSRLLNALFKIDSECSLSDKQIPRSLMQADIPVQRYSPAEALSLPRCTVSLDFSVNLISADYMWAYPPGAPIVVPGEIISDEIIEKVEYMQNCGVDIHTAFSESGKIQVVNIMRTTTL